MRFPFLLLLVSLVLLVTVHAACPDTFPDNCGSVSKRSADAQHGVSVISRSAVIRDVLQRIKPKMDCSNPWTACVSNAQMAASWQQYLAANNNTVPFGPNGVGLVDVCRVANKFCLQTMISTCACVSTCEQAFAWSEFAMTITPVV